MREIKYLSPTSLSLFESDRMEFYLRYCAENRPPRMPQNHAMAIGSAFDAFVKNYIVGALGIPDPTGQFAIETIFESQVEPQNRDWALEHGVKVFEQYQKCGALADLMIELASASTTPRFEFTVESRIAHTRYADGVPILGKPDCHFTLPAVDGQPRTLTVDWKVNGYCAERPVSPKKGYVKCRAVGEVSKQHRECQTMRIGGIDTNISFNLEDIDPSWAAQTCMYMWVLGEPIPTRSLTGIEQLACRGGESALGLRVASHRMRIGEAFQLSLISRIVAAWDAIQRGHIFTELSFEESRARCLTLDSYYEAYTPTEGGNTKHEEWFRTITRAH